MNKKLGLAVAGALLALSSTANAGITIPAGDWTVDISGNVNAFYINGRAKDTNTITGGLAAKEDANNSSASSINTGLLPSWLTIGAKTRQNDLDVAWAISFQPGASTSTGLMAGGGSEFRQAYFTVGDASWGSIKIGKDLGVFGSDAILSDMTLLGVGGGVGGANNGATTTLGRIGAGYMYADFTGQINYTTPNWNGFQATVGIDQPWLTSAHPAVGGSATESATVSGAQSQPAYVGKAVYSWAGDVSGKVWAEMKSQKANGISTGVSGVTEDDTSRVWGAGANVNVAGLGLTGYYYDGKGAGTTSFLALSHAQNGKRRDSDGYYLQATYVIPTGTKLGVSWGKSKLDEASGETATTLVKENKMTTFGAYHPLTKSVNLVAEYSKVQSENHSNQKNDQNVISVGGILFF